MGTKWVFFSFFNERKHSISITWTPQSKTGSKKKENPIAHIFNVFYVPSHMPNASNALSGVIAKISDKIDKIFISISQMRKNKTCQD